MVKLNIKPLSVNKAWKGKRFKTEDYKRYERNCLLLLPKLTIPADNLRLSIVFGVSNKANDIDNGLKPIIDILQKKYDFNDSRIYELNVRKEITKKGYEFILFEIEGIIT